MKNIKRFFDYETNPVMFLFWSYSYWIMQMTLSKEQMKAHNKKVAARRRSA